jgi:thymidine kinase
VVVLVDLEVEVVVVELLVDELVLVVKLVDVETEVEVVVVLVDFDVEVVVVDELVELLVVVVDVLEEVDVELDVEVLVYGLHSKIISSA